MENNEYFLQTKEISKKLVEFDMEYTEGRTEITGLYLETCIRFFKDFPDLFDRRIVIPKEERQKRRNWYSHLNDFSIVDTSVLLTAPKSETYFKLYDFKNGLVMVKHNNYIDLVEMKNLEIYLQNMGLSIDSASEIKSGKKLLLARPNDFKQKMKFKSEK